MSEQLDLLDAGVCPTCNRYSDDTHDCVHDLLEEIDGLQDQVRRTAAYGRRMCNKYTGLRARLSDALGLCERVSRGIDGTPIRVPLDEDVIVRLVRDLRARVLEQVAARVQTMSITIWSVAEAWEAWKYRATGRHADGHSRAAELLRHYAKLIREGREPEWCIRRAGPVRR